MKLKLLIPATLIAAGAICAISARNHALNVSSKGSFPGAPTNSRTYQVNGRIRSIAVAGKTITVAHEAIKGFMPAMTMPFVVKDKRLLAGLRANDEVHFELSVTEDDSWISHVEKIGEANSFPSPSATTQTPDELHNGEIVPDFAFTDQNGKPVRLRDFRGKPLVLTFIYTRCPLPNFCPLMSKNFEALQARLAKADPGKFHLLSLTIDPMFDTPAVLKGYATLHHADESLWSFGTGTDEQINSVASMFGLVHEPESGLIAHNLRTALIAADGRLIHVWKSNVWTPYEVQRSLEESIKSPLISKVP